MDPRVSQAIEYGSALLVLGKRENGTHISDDECMRYLKDAPVTEASLIAYRFLCLNRNPNEHYIDGVHLLQYLHEKADEYGAIYFMSNGEVETKLRKNDESSENVTNFLMKSIFRLQTEKRFGIKVRVICNRPEDEVGDVPRDLLPLILKANSGKLTSLLSPLSDADRAEIMLSIDQISFLKKVDLPNKLGRILARCALLTEKAPAYWKSIASNEYRKGITKMQKKGQLGNITRENVLESYRLLPGLFPTNIDQYSDLAYKVALLDDIIRQYVLGFPVHQGVSAPDVVNVALTYLSKEGKEKYVEMMRNFNASAHNVGLAVPDHLLPAKMVKRNETDVLDEQLTEYSPFDRLTYFSGMNVYTFTRPEFENLNKTDKNQYTNEELPMAIQMEISLRLQLAKKLNLPPPGTMTELLTRVEKGELYESDSDKERRKRHNLSGLGGGGLAEALAGISGGGGNLQSALMDYVLARMLFNATEQ